jgi:hypothetical protein
MTGVTRTYQLSSYHVQVRTYSEVRDHGEVHSVLGSAEPALHLLSHGEVLDHPCASVFEPD